MNRQIKFLSLLCLVVAAWMLSGCGNLYRINYSNIKADLNYSGSQSVSLAVLAGLAGRINPACTNAA